MTEWPQILIDIDGKLFPHFQLTTYQRVLYHHLLAKTFAQDETEVTLTIPQLSKAIAASEFTARKTIRELSEVGVVEAEQTRRGYRISPILPAQLELPDVTDDAANLLVDIEAIDFFVSRKFLKPLMERESNQCFYCLRKITSENCELDHVVSQLDGGGNSYKNIVASCHNCNTRKQATSAQDFVRELFRNGLLNEDEFSERLNSIDRLQDGEMVPDVRSIPV